VVAALPFRRALSPAVGTAGLYVKEGSGIECYTSDKGHALVRKIDLPGKRALQRNRRQPQAR